MTNISHSEHNSEGTCVCVCVCGTIIVYNACLVLYTCYLWPHHVWGVDVLYLVLSANILNYLHTMYLHLCIMLDNVTDGGKPKDSSDEAASRLSSIPIAVNNGKSNSVSNNIHGKLCMY